MKKMVTQKPILDELKRCGALSITTRPSKIIMYSIADFMVVMGGKIPPQDVSEWIKLYSAASEGRRHRVPATPMVRSTLSCGQAPGLDALAMACYEPLQTLDQPPRSSMYSDPGDGEGLFSPVRGFHGCNSPIALPLARSGRPPTSSSLSLPSSSIIPQSPRVVMPTTNAQAALSSKTHPPKELPPFDSHLLKRRNGMGSPRGTSTRSWLQMWKPFGIGVKTRFNWIGRAHMPDRSNPRPGSHALHSSEDMWDMHRSTTRLPGLSSQCPSRMLTQIHISLWHLWLM